MQLIKTCMPETEILGANVNEAEFKILDNRSKRDRSYVDLIPSRFLRASEVGCHGAPVLPI